MAVPTSPDKMIQAVIDRILTEGYETTIARLSRQLGTLPARLSGADPKIRAIGLGGLEEAMTFWIKQLIRDASTVAPQTAEPCSATDQAARQRDRPHGGAQAVAGAAEGRARVKSPASAPSGPVAPSARGWACAIIGPP